MTKTKLYTPQAQRFSRQWWFGGLRNGFFVVVITLLIWIYADMDVTDDRDFRVTVNMTVGEGGEFVLLKEAPIEVAFELRGTRSALNDLQRELDDAGSEVQYDVSARHGPRERAARTEDVLKHALGLARRGLSVLSVSRETLPFNLDRRIRKRATIELDAPGAKFIGEPKIEPSEIFIWLAESDLAAMKLPQDQPIPLKTARLDVRTVPAGKEDTKELEILKPPMTRFPVELETEKVKVTIRIEQRTDEKQLRVAVQVLAPHTWTQDGTWSEYKLVMKDPLEWQPQITVRGARKDIDRLRAEDIDAHVALTEDDKTPVASWLTRPVVVNLPRGKELQLVGPRPNVNFKLEKRVAPPPAP